MSGYGPTLLSSIGYGAVIPLIAVIALREGASIGTAAFITALLGIGQVVGDLPAGWLAARLGDRRAMIAACLLDASALSGMFFSGSIATLGLAVFIDGMAGAVFGLARQTYLTEAIPLRFRARALSSLGGVFRIGFFVGPLIGAGIIALGTPRDAFAFAACMSLTAAVVTWALPDLVHDAQLLATSRRTSVRTIISDHKRVFATQGIGVLVLMAIRSARQAIIPLWCESHGLSASTTSLVFALSMGFDVLLFFPGGWIMDRFGRWWVVVPAMVVMGVGMAILPLAHTAWAIAAVAALLGIGNGTSSGIVMTLGSDASPPVGRPQFLSVWRLFGDAGNSSGPLVITLVTVAAPLAAASLVLGVLSWAGAAWLGRWVPGRPERRAPTT
ncbi:MAG: MFS transporter [Propionibacterium sp.]|nr:MFS transporter [Propionibacterium sp.]